MTEHDADQLNAWLSTLSLKQFGLLWYWVTLAYMQRCREGR